MTILLLRARGGESRFAQMLIKKGYFCAQYPQYIETPLPYGEHQVSEKLLAVTNNPLVDAKAGIPAIAVSDSLGLDILIKAIMAHSDQIPLFALPFRLVLIGDKVTHYAAQKGVAASLTIPGMCEQALAEAKEQLAPLDMLLLTSDKPPAQLVEHLSQICHKLNVAKVFARCRKMEPPPVSLAVTAVVSCTSTALSQGTIARLDPSVLNRPFFGIGPKTVQAALALGFKNVTMSTADTLESLFKTIAKHFGPPLLGRAL